MSPEQNGTVVTETSQVLPPPDLTESERINLGKPSSLSVQAQADLTREYVGVQGYAGYWQGFQGAGGVYVRQLPNPIDDLSLTFGSRLYEEDMGRDPQIKSTLSILVMAVLAQKMQIRPAVMESDPNYAEAKKYRDFCAYNLDNLRVPFKTRLYELLEGSLKMGHKLAEQVYAMEDLGQGEGEQMVLKDLKPRPQNATAFVVDPYMETLGYLHVRPGQALPTLSTWQPLDPTSSQIPKLLPKRKFFAVTNEARNNDPRGTSHLRHVYMPWWKKQQLNPEHLAYLRRFAQPGYTANIDKDMRDVPLYDKPPEQGGHIIGKINIVQATTNALAEMAGGAVAAFVGTEVTMHEAKSEGRVIFDSYDHEDHQMAKGILYQTLTTEQSQSMARAASSIHQDVFALFISYLREVLEWLIREQVLQPLVEYNYGEEPAKTLTPIISLGKVSVEDIPKMAAAVAQLALAGVLHRSEYPGIREDLNLPPADPELEAQDYEKAQQDKMQQAENQKLLAAQKARDSMLGPGGGQSSAPAEGAKDSKPTQKPSNQNGGRAQGAPERGQRAA